MGLGCWSDRVRESWEAACAAGQVSRVEGLAKAMAAGTDVRARKEPGRDSQTLALP